MSCCPPGSLGAAPLSKEVPKGKVLTVVPSVGEKKIANLPMPLYWTGASAESNPKRVVFVFADLFGMETGNHKAVADSIATSLGPETAVLMPDLFRGKPIMQEPSKRWLPEIFSVPGMIYKIKARHTPASIESDLKDLIFPWLKSKMDVEKAVVSCVGFCYGGWVMARAMAFDDVPFKCGVGIHPTFKPEEMHGGTPEGLAEKIGMNPCLLLAASSDTAMKPDGKVTQAMAKTRGVPTDQISVEFPTMEHGWVARGDSTDEETAKQQREALKLTVEFIKKF